MPNPSNPSPPVDATSPCESMIRQRIAQTQRQVKGVDLVGGILTLVIGAVVYLLAAAVVDHWVVDGGLGFWGRWWLCLAFWIGVAVVFVRQLLPSLRWRIHPLFAASTIEQSRPSLKNSLINFLLLRGHRREVASPIYQAIERRAAADLAGIESDTAVDRSRVVRLGVVLAGVLAVFAIYLVVSPKNPLRSAARVLWPWSDVGAPTRVAIREVRPGDVVAFYGDRINVSAEIVGLGDEESPQLFYSTADGQTVEQGVSMTRPKGEYRYQCDLPPDPSGLQQSCEYWIAVGDARGRRYRVAVQAAPAIEVDRVTYHYPPHLGLSDRTVPRQGDLRAVEGTEVTIHAKANVDIKPGTAEIDLGCTGRHGLRMNVAGGEATGRFTLRLKTPEPNETLNVPTAEYNVYQIRFADVQGRDNPRPIRYPIEVLPDRSVQPPASDPKDAETTHRGQPERKDGDNARRDAERTADGHAETKNADGARHGDETAADRQSSPPAGATGSPQSPSQRQPNEPQLASQTDQRPEQRIDPDSNPADAIQEILNDRKEQQAPSKGNASDGSGQSSAEKQQSGQSQSSEQPSSGDRQSGGEQKSGGGEKSGESQPQSGGGTSGQSQKKSDQQKSDDQPQPSSGDQSQSSSASQQPSEGGSTSSAQQKPSVQPSSDRSQEKSESAASEAKDQQDRSSEQSKGERQKADDAGGQGSKNPSSGGGKDQSPQPGGQSSEKQNSSGQAGGQKSDDAKSDGQKSEGQKTDGGRGDGDKTNTDRRDGKPSPGKPMKTEDGQIGKTKSEQPTDEKPDAQATDGQPAGTKSGDSRTLQPSREESAERKQAGLPQSGDQPKPEKGQGVENPAVQPKGDASQSQSQQQSPKEIGSSRPSTGGPGSRKSSSEGTDRKPSESGTNAENVSDKAKGASADNAEKKQSTGASSGSPADGQKLANQPSDSNLPAGTSKNQDAAKRSGVSEEKTPPSDARPSGASSEEPSGPSSNKSAEVDVMDQQAKGTRPTDKPVADRSKLGGQPGKPSDEKPTAEPTEAVADQANLEYARRQTELALEYLRDQLAQEKPKLLERLGWSKEDAQRFLQRWQQMRESASQPGADGQSARQRLDAELRSLGLRPKTVELRHGAVPIDRSQGNRDASRYAPPPVDWAEQYREYTRGVAGEGRADDKPNRRESRGH
ncbi:MAG: hypothetical protein ABFC77_11870 [Thermoguttaceae bacterium]